VLDRIESIPEQFKAVLASTADRWKRFWAPAADGQALARSLLDGSGTLPA